MWETSPLSALLNSEAEEQKTAVNPNEIGKRLGIGVRVAGRIAQQRMQEKAESSANQAPDSATSAPRATPINPLPIQPLSSQSLPSREEVLNASRDLAAKSHKYTRAAGRGVGGFLRPFSRVGGILWLQVTGFFFGMFALYFLQDLWRTHASYAQGPDHQRFLIDAGLTILFGYLCTSAFWRARRR
jgi:hypothetical protein